ncbi:MAG: heparinase II/III family protein [Opitutales bacterium]|nr:heparinase II/III family protein [Opitutales bacterium]
MNDSRRKFLNTSLFAGAGMVLAPWQRLVAETGVTGGSGPASGLLFGPEDLERIRTSIRHPRFAALWAEISGRKRLDGVASDPAVGDGAELAQTGTVVDLEADTRFLRDELNVYDHVRHMLRARRILERSAFVYAVDGDAGHRDVAVLALQRILDYPKWDYFLDGGELVIGLQRAPEASIAMSLALGWLGDVLDDATKAEVKKQIAEKGAPACFQSLYSMRYPDRVRGWAFDPESEHDFEYDMSRWPIILNSTNLKVIPIAGLTMACCVLKDEHPQVNRWLDMAIQSARAFAPMYGRDGSYDEGISYWGYTTLHLALFAETLYRTFGIDHRDIIDFGGTVRHALQMSMPTVGNPNDAVNFGDAKTIGDLSVAGWIASLRNDGIAQHTLLNLGEIRSQYGIGWFDPDVSPTAPDASLLDVRYVNDWVLSRTGWDIDACQVAFRSGGPANHEHADRNSVIFKAYGERLFHDPFNAAYMPTLPLWKLRQTAAHTAVLIDGKGHQYHDGSEGTNPSWAESHITRYEANEHWMLASSDATSAYRLVDDNVRSIVRTILFLKPDVLIILDRVLLDKSAAPVQARFQVYNDDGNGKAVAGGDSFRIERPNAFVSSFCRALGGMEVSAGRLDIEPGVAADTFIGMEENIQKEYQEYPYVALDSVPAMEHSLLTVSAAQRAEAEPAVVKIQDTNSGWRVEIQHNGRAHDVYAHRDGTIEVG